MKIVTPTQFSLMPPLGPSAQNGVHKISCSSYCRHTPGTLGIIFITIHYYTLYSTHMVRLIGPCVIMAHTFWPFVICAVPVSVPRQTLNFSFKIIYMRAILDFFYLFLDFLFKSRNIPAPFDGHSQASSSSRQDRQSWQKEENSQIYYMSTQVHNLAKPVKIQLSNYKFNLTPSKSELQF